jgi:hypothetical protein
MGAKTVLVISTFAPAKHGAFLVPLLLLGVAGGSIIAGFASAVEGSSDNGC